MTYGHFSEEEDDVFIGINEQGNKLIIGVKTQTGDYQLHDIPIEDELPEQKPVKVTQYNKQDGTHVDDYYRDHRRF